MNDEVKMIDELIETIKQTGPDSSEVAAKLQTIAIAKPNIYSLSLSIIQVRRAYFESKLDYSPPEYHSVTNLVMLFVLAMGIGLGFMIGVYCTLHIT